MIENCGWEAAFTYGETINLSYKDVIMNVSYWPSHRHENVRLPDGLVWDPNTLVLSRPPITAEMEVARREFRSHNRLPRAYWEVPDESPAPPEEVIVEEPNREEIRAPPLQVIQEEGWTTPQEEPTWLDRLNARTCLRTNIKRNSRGRTMVYLNRAIHNNSGQYKELSFNFDFDRNMEDFFETIINAALDHFTAEEQVNVWKMFKLGSQLLQPPATGGPVRRGTENRRRRRDDGEDDGPPRQRVRL